jgi:hypothetical protein
MPSLSPRCANLCPMALKMLTTTSVSTTTTAVIAVIEHARLAGRITSRAISAPSHPANVNPSTPTVNPYGVGVR